jgi:Holliday junction resolvase RusA-like endonuclease
MRTANTLGGLIAERQVEIELRGEPQGKGRPRFAMRTGHAYTPHNTAKYEAQLRFAAGEAMGQRRPFEGPVEVFMVAHFMVPSSWPKYKQSGALNGTVAHVTRPDADNLIKMLDALNRVCWDDDSQIVRVMIEKRYSAIPRIHIKVTPL